MSFYKYNVQCECVTRALSIPYLQYDSFWFFVIKCVQVWFQLKEGQVSTSFNLCSTPFVTVWSSSSNEFNWEDDMDDNNESNADLRSRSSRQFRNFSTKLASFPVCEDSAVVVVVVAGDSSSSLTNCLVCTSVVALRSDVSSGCWLTWCRNRIHLRRRTKDRKCL